MKRLLPILMCIFALVSCGSDDEETNNAPAITKALLECGSDWHKGVHQSGQYDTWMNFENGVCEIHTFYGNFMDSDKTGTFQYELTGNVLTLKQDGAVKYQSTISAEIVAGKTFIQFQYDNKDNLLYGSLEKTKYTVVKDGYMKGYMEKY